jgi:hypothetical protein
MKSLKSLFKPGGGGGGSGGGVGNKVTAAPSTSGGLGWEDFSLSSNPPGGMGDQAPPAAREPHPLTQEWAARINNRNVRAAFLVEPIESYTAARDLRVWTGTWNTNGKSPPADLDISEWLHTSRSSFAAGDGDARHMDVVVVGRVLSSGFRVKVEGVGSMV